MKQLSLEKIKFINSYLEKSDVIFVDIRAELTDHIASAVEEKMEAENLDFYEAFKDFMVDNKKELLKEKNHFLPSIIRFSKTLYKWYNLVIAVLVAIVFYFISETILPFINVLIFALIMCFCLYQTASVIITKKRFAYLEQATFSLTVIYFGSLFFNGFYKDFQGNFYSLGIVSFLLIAFFIHYGLTILKFTNKIYLK
mgnify:FL=1